MQEAEGTFSYTSGRGSYLNMVGVFIFLLVVEGGATELLITLFVPIYWIKLVIMVVTIVLSFFTIIMLLCPLWTKHRLTDTHLYLRYGLTLNVSIPRSAIGEVLAVRKTPSRVQPISASYEGKKQRIVACFSERGMVLLTFKQPLVLKVGGKKRTVMNILLNVNERDKFLHALSIGTMPDAGIAEAKQTTLTSEAIVEEIH